MSEPTVAQGFPPLYPIDHVPAGRVLVVAPHPDDEILGCGGAIALHGLRGDEVHVALVTQGEDGGDASTRLDESRAAAAVLGDAQVHCLGAPDGSVASDAGLAGRLAELAARVAPTVVYAPSPFEMHPDHVATLRATAAALTSKPLPSLAKLLLFEVNTESMASFLLDITPVAERKRDALAAFASQLGRIDIVDKCDARGRARTVNVDLPEITHAEAFMDVAPSDVAARLDEVVALGRALGLAR